MQCIYCETVHDHLTLCCQNAKVRLQEKPYTIKQLFVGSYNLSSNFRENITQYNSPKSFVSFGANIKLPSGHSPYCSGIQGDVHHYISS